MKLSIVIINYNTSGDLDRCLESIERCPPRWDYSVVVVDNASTDPGLPPVREKHPEVRWVLNSRNEGYARGANIGMAAMEAQYHLVLNPDIVVRPGSLDALIDFADAHPKAGIVGPQLLNENGTVQDSCRRFYTLRTLLLRRTILGRIWRKSGEVDRHLMRDFDHASARPVDWILGGCMLVRRRALDRTGPMDERFFLYFEDVDWCFRMWQAGWDVMYTPDARFVHRHRRDSSGGMLKKSFWLHLSSLISFYEKWGLVVYLIKRWRGPLSTLLLWLLDMGALAVSFVGSYALRSLLNPFFSESLFPLSEYRPLLNFAFVLVTVTFLLMGRYRHGSLGARPRLGERLQRTGAVSLLLLASTYLSHQNVYSRAVLLLFIPVFALASGIVEKMFHSLRLRMEAGYFNLERTLLVGDPAGIEAWLGDGRAVREQGLDPVGWLAVGEWAGQPLAGGEVPWLGGFADIEHMVSRYRVSQVVFWRWPRAGGGELALLERLHRRRIRLRWRVDEAALFSAGARTELFAGADSAVLEPGDQSATTALLRRAADILAGALLALAAAVPFWLIRPLAGLSAVPAEELRGVDGSDSPRIVRDAAGAVKPLWWQAPLAVSLLSGRITLWGARPGGPRAEHDSAGWSLDWRTPGLTGRWAGSSPRDPWRTLFHDPAGLSGLAGTVADGQEEA